MCVFISPIRLQRQWRCYRIGSLIKSKGQPLRLPLAMALHPFERLSYFPYLLNRGFANVAVLHKFIVRDCAQQVHIYYLVSVLQDCGYTTLLVYSFAFLRVSFLYRFSLWFPCLIMLECQSFLLILNSHCLFVIL